MQTVLYLPAQRSTEHNLESHPQWKQENSGFIYLFTVYCTAATQIYYKHAISFPAVYLYRHNQTVFVASVFLTNFCIFDSLSTMTHER